MFHAGSGSGQVDQDIRKNFAITALDISSQALNLYKFYNGPSSKTLKASIFNIPAKNKVFDGIYNLGVHEHFSGSENRKRFAEYKRVLNDSGKIVLFWPPKFGVSVIFLNTLHFVLNDILRQKIRLHPKEISLIESERQVENVLSESGFKLTHYYFGSKDLFTHYVIVVKIKKIQ